MVHFCLHAGSISISSSSFQEPATYSTPGYTVDSEISMEPCCLPNNPPVSYNVPSFIDDSRYKPRNVDRREERKKEKVTKLQTEIKLLKNELKRKDEVLDQLCSNVDRVKCQKDNVIRKLRRQNDVILSDFVELEGSIEDTCVHDLPKTCEKSEDVQVSDEIFFNFQTKEGRRYSPAIRKLYYSLLSAQVPPGKIAAIVRTVLSSLFPSVDVSTLRLPAESCAGYMRREELKTVSAAHQATVLASEEKLYLNSDGTTKFQKKLNATAFNGIVLSVSEIPDGKADSVIDDIGVQLQKLRNIAKELGIPNYDMFNWTMIHSSSSDSASTQKRLNHLLQEKKDEELHPVAESDLDIVKIFCGMHLGVNLRKAFMHSTTDMSVDHHDNTIVDTFVYEFCKLFGSYGRWCSVSRFFTLSLKSE